MKKNVGRSVQLPRIELNLLFLQMLAGLLFLDHRSHTRACKLVVKADAVTPTGQIVYKRLETEPES